MGFLQLQEAWAALVLQLEGFSLQWFFLLRNGGSRRPGLSSSRTRAQELWLIGSRALAQWVWRMGLVVPQLKGSSHSRDPTHVSCIGRIIFTTESTGEPDKILFKFKNSVVKFSHWLFTVTVKNLKLCLSPCRISAFCFPQELEG